MRFVCADGEPQYEHMLDQEQLATLEREAHELVWLDGPPDTADEWIERLRGADGLFLLWLLPRGVLRAKGTPFDVLYREGEVPTEIPVK